MDHQQYGVWPWRQYFPRTFSEAPFSLDFFGTLPFDTAAILPSILILFVAGCFSQINKELAAIFSVLLAALLTYMGFITIGPSALIAGFVLAIILALVVAKRRIEI